MGVLCCRIPDFLIHLTYRRQPSLKERPLALLGPDERVVAVSPHARRAHVAVEMTPRQAQMRCADVALRPLDMAWCQSEQVAFLAALGLWELPVEWQSWGLAYVDLHGLAQTRDAVQPLATELGRQVRQSLGEDLQPALGWDSSKFTARAAASYVAPGHMRLVEKSGESRFLAPLPVRLLPLAREALQQLEWLGIRSLGQFAALPAAAVWQRFGQVGRIAQRWAQGRDERPVCTRVHAGEQALAVDLEPPTALLPIAVDALMAELAPRLARMAQRLEGCRRLRIELAFVNGETRTAELVCVEPVSEAERLRRLISGRLAALNWPAEAQHIGVPYMESGELATQQMSLFVETVAQAATPGDVAQQLAGRYGPIFFQGEVHDAEHLIDERRSRLVVAA